ncbi:MAG TPA: hypothetical protein VFG76_11615 [Candidatus Polarisedimenticolia bacterium]|nr:hypothetical protein [Candidatus Polarisedimenticolia bacterium]
MGETYTGQSRVGSTQTETNTRRGQEKKEGEMSDKSAVMEGMSGAAGDVAAAARRRQERLKKQREEANTEEAITRRKALINR